MDEPRILYPRLSLATRARLRSDQFIDRAAARLVELGHDRAAAWLWRLCGMW